MNPSIKSIVPTAAACALALAACGGGGGAKPAASLLPDVERARTLTGSTAPTETAEQISARVAGILGRSDSLIISTTRGETTHPDLPSLTFRTNCRATACSYRLTETGESRTIRLRDFEIISSTRGRPVLTRNGITLSEAGTNDSESYGAWMLHSSFGVQSLGGEEDIGGTRHSISFRRALAAGDLTRSLPTATDVTATWRGVMVGTPGTGAAAGNVLQGDAALTYTIAGGRGMLDAAFTDIKDLDRLAAHTTETVRFDDVPVATNGTFETGLTGNRIQGGFYGPGHVEAAGVFEQSNILGAFGAMRP